MAKKQWDTIWINATLASCEGGYGLLEKAAIAADQGSIVWMGTMLDLPDKPEALAQHVHDVEGACITPGFIDCHTHLIYAGNRAKEFEMRLQGLTYEEIARRGGGIQSTVKATRAASEDELLQESLKRARQLLKSGVTTVEIKSGYGLNWETEAKMLHVAKKIETILPLTVVKTFLGAHTIPAEFQGDTDSYVELLCREMLPAVAKEKLADAVDVFCEKIAFTLEQTQRIFATAKALGLDLKCHAEQLTYSGSAELAASLGALSVDHLEHLSDDGIDAMAASGTVAVLLPGAYYYLRETTMPPVNRLREKQIPIAIATDCNPGTSPATSLLLMLNMACTVFRLTPEEALQGVTKYAAYALGLDHTHGTLTPGKVADLAIWDIKHPAELSYYIGANSLKQLVKSGKIVV